LCARSGGKEELRRKNKRDWLKSEMEYVEKLLVRKTKGGGVNRIANNMLIR
jgi:hypothetical protein